MKQWLLISSIAVLISQTCSAQNCNDLTGMWRSEAGAMLNIKEIDDSTGLMKVSFKSPSSFYPDGPFDGTGYVGNMNKSVSHRSEQSIVTTVTFSFRWPEESVSAWVGHCNVDHQGRSAIYSQWLESRPVADKPIEHTLTGVTIFRPYEALDSGI